MTKIPLLLYIINEFMRILSQRGRCGLVEMTVPLIIVNDVGGRMAESKHQSSSGSEHMSKLNHSEHRQRLMIVDQLCQPTNCTPVFLITAQPLSNSAEDLCICQRHQRLRGH